MSVAIGQKEGKSPSRSHGFSDQQIRQVANSDPASIAQWTIQVARERGISARPHPNEQFIKAVSRLSDGVIDLDPVEELLVALGRAGVISAFQRGLLQVRYLR